MLETGRFYTITLNIFDASNHRILPCSNLRVTTTLDPLYFEVNIRMLYFFVVE